MCEQSRIDLVKDVDDYDYDNRIIVNKNVRKRSRKRILEYLEEKCRGSQKNWKSQKDLEEFFAAIFSSKCDIQSRIPLNFQKFFYVYFCKGN
jgi:hypothetical protein